MFHVGPVGGGVQNRHTALQASFHFNMLWTFQSDFGNFKLLIPADIQALVFAPGQEYDDNPYHSTFVSLGLKQQCKAGSAHLSQADIHDNSSSYKGSSMAAAHKVLYLDQHFLPGI